MPYQLKKNILADGMQPVMTVSGCRQRRLARVFAGLVAAALIAAMILMGLGTVAHAAISETGSATDVGGGTTASITHGQTIAANDVIVAMIHSNDAGNDVTDNNGAYAFAEEFEETNPGQTSSYAIYYRVAGASEPATYSWNINNDTEWSVQIRIFSGVDTASVWDVSPSVSTRSSAGSGTTATAPTMTTSNDGAMGIIAIFSDSTETFSNPTNGYGTEVEPASRAALHRRVISAPGHLLGQREHRVLTYLLQMTGWRTKSH
jgi:hypothetical protein